MGAKELLDEMNAGFGRKKDYAMTHPIVSDVQREAFEKWAKDVGHNIRRTHFNNGYATIDTHNAWSAWKSAISTQPKVVPASSIEALIDVWKDDAPTYYVDALRKLLPTAIIGEGD